MDLALNNLQWLICHKTKSNCDQEYFPISYKKMIDVCRKYLKAQRN